MAIVCVGAFTHTFGGSVMLRCVLAVLFAAGMASGQDKVPTKPKLTDVPDIPAEKADDTEEVKLVKKLLRTQAERLDLMHTRIQAGQFTGGAAYLQLFAAQLDLIAAADELYPEAKDRLPWYEYRVTCAKKALEFNAPRIKQGVEEPQLKPQLEGEIYKAELALLKLKKQIKK